MGKKLSAAQKQQISATLKRKWAEKKARLSETVLRVGKGEGVVQGQPITKVTWDPTPRSSNDGREQIAADIVALLDDEISNLLLVRVIDRILRP